MKRLIKKLVFDTWQLAAEWIEYCNDDIDEYADEQNVVVPGGHEAGNLEQGGRRPQLFLQVTTNMLYITFLLGLFDTILEYQYRLQNQFYGN